MPFWEKMKIYNLHKEGFSKEELAIGWGGVGRYYQSDRRRYEEEGKTS